MARISPTLEGFRAAWRRPSLIFAEIAWRWNVGAAGAVLFLFVLAEYLHTLPVANNDVLLMRTRQPVLVWQAIAHVFRGSFGRVALAMLLSAVALSVAWIFAASLGRAATLRGLIEYFRREGKDRVSPDAPPPCFRALLGLNFLRVVLSIAALCGLVGAAIFSRIFSSADDPHPGLAVLLFLGVSGFVCFLSWELNWFLSLAALFTVRDGEGSLGAIAAAVSFSRERAGALAAVSTWTGLLHLAALGLAGSAISFPLLLAQVAPGWLTLAGVVVVALAYFAVADWICIARMGGYVCIAETPKALLAPTPEATYVPPSPGQAVGPNIPPQTSPPQTSIDQGESILSDVPGLS